MSYYETRSVYVVVVGGEYLSVFVWVVGSCLAVSGLEVTTLVYSYLYVSIFIILVNSFSCACT